MRKLRTCSLRASVACRRLCRQRVGTVRSIRSHRSCGRYQTYTYVGGNPISYVDPMGLDIAAIENGPTSGNPILLCGIPKPVLFAFIAKWQGDSTRSLLMWIWQDNPEDLLFAPSLVVYLSRS